jgi:membrane-bound lytic murein transglycosylase B
MARLSAKGEMIYVGNRIPVAIGMTFTVVAFFSLVMIRPCQAAGEKDFDGWLDDVRVDALAGGISEKTVDAVLRDLKPIRRVIELDRNQPELKLTLKEYLDRVVTRKQVERGRKRLTKHRDLLTEVSRRYSVQPRFLVALWGIETNYGRLSGGFPVVGAVATLAYDGRRRDFFRRELLNALHILDEGHITPEKMRGSWAGAMGQLQLMPSTFRSYAVDFNGDGRIDIWSNLGDAFASGANYLSRRGWNEDQTWGREVRLTRSIDRKLIGLETQLLLADWQIHGVRRLNGRELPLVPDLTASLIQPDGPGGRVFLVYDNYRVIMKWNKSILFGIAVGLLSDGVDTH